MILSIESSCDDSSLAVTRVEDSKLLWHKKISQEMEHSKFGGVVPELASRLHAVALPKLLYGVREILPKIKAVAVTNEPGLSVTLNEGVVMAKTIATFKNIPIIPVNHLKGHIYSLFINRVESRLPMLVILISGGHTMIIRAKSIDSMEILATSIDDSVGESFDKVAKMMGLGYPGGPIVEKFARRGDENRFDFPIPLRNSPLIAFSLSGLKNAVRVAINSMGGSENLSKQDIFDISASFQKALVGHLIQKSKKLFSKESIKDVALVGGVSANSYIRDSFNRLSREFGKRVHTAELEFCSDNAAMIGRYGVDALKSGLYLKPESIEVKASRRLKVGEFL